MKFNYAFFPCGLILLTILTAAVAGGQDSAASRPDAWALKVESFPGIQPASSLMGEWSKSDPSTINFINPNTGSYSDPSGERGAYRFFPDGTYPTVLGNQHVHGESCY